MEKILTFSDLEAQNKKKRTRREEFLGKMESIVPWSDIVSLVKPYYYSNRTGRPATRLEVILRMYFLQIWFSISDEVIVKRPSFWKKKGLSRIAEEFDRNDERRLISKRQKVEYVFHVLKDIFRFRKLPYKGIAKNAERLMAAYANVNLYMLAIAGRRFCPVFG